LTFGAAFGTVGPLRHKQLSTQTAKVLEVTDRFPTTFRHHIATLGPCSVC